MGSEESVICLLHIVQVTDPRQVVRLPHDIRQPCIDSVYLAVRVGVTQQPGHSLDQQVVFRDLVFHKELAGFFRILFDNQSVEFLSGDHTNLQQRFPERPHGFNRVLCKRHSVLSFILFNQYTVVHDCFVRRQVQRDSIIHDISGRAAEVDFFPCIHTPSELEHIQVFRIPYIPPLHALKGSFKFRVYFTLGCFFVVVVISPQVIIPCNVLIREQFLFCVVVPEVPQENMFRRHFHAMGNLVDHPYCSPDRPPHSGRRYQAGDIVIFDGIIDIFPVAFRNLFLETIFLCVVDLHKGLAFLAHNLQHRYAFPFIIAQRFAQQRVAEPSPAAVPQPLHPFQLVRRKDVFHFFMEPLYVDASFSIQRTPLDNLFQRVFMPGDNFTSKDLFQINPCAECRIYFFYRGAVLGHDPDIPFAVECVLLQPAAEIRD